MSGDLILGVDCSTTGVKAVVWNLQGQSVSMGRSSIGLSTPQSGWGEQNPADWWTATIEAIGQATKQIEVNRLAALAITHQRETFVCLDEEGKAIRPAILWLDTRATREIELHGTQDIHTITGKPPNTATSWYKMLWLKEHEPRALECAHRVVDVHGYLVNRLTGEWHTSYGSLDPLGVLDLRSCKLDASLIDRLGLTSEHFGQLSAPGEIIGTVKRDVAEQLGLAPGLKVVAGLGDGQAAGMGVGITRSGDAYLNLGTGIVSGTFSTDYQTDVAFRTMTGGIKGTYLLETFFGGGTYNINWFVDRFSDIGEKPFGLELTPHSLLETAAAELPEGADGLIMLPYLTGVLTPYWDSHARGVLFGLSPAHGKAHVYRALLEGLAMEQRLSTTAAEQASGTQTQQFRVMGGGSRSNLWCQIIADVLNRPIEIALEEEATCLGAAMLAAAGAGFFSSVEEAVREMSASGGRTFHPDPAHIVKYEHLYGVYRDLYPLLRDQFTRLQEVRHGLQ